MDNEMCVRERRRGGSGKGRVAEAVIR